MNASTSSSSAVTSAVTSDLLQVSGAGGLQLGANDRPERGEQIVPELVEDDRADRCGQRGLVADAERAQRGGVHGRVLHPMAQLAFHNAQGAEGDTQLEGGAMLE